jgi:cell division protein FtsN
MTMAEYRETHEIRTESGSAKSSSATPWLAFFVGALLIAVVAIFFMNAQGSFSGPAGKAEINIKSPVTTERAEPVRPAEPARPAPAEPAPAK